MKSPRLIVGILAVVHLVLAVVVYCYPPPLDWLGYPLFMLFPSQGNLIGIWATLGRRPPLRVALAFIGIVVCLRIASGPEYYSNSDEAIRVLTIETASVIALLLLFRFTGLAMATTPLEPWRPTPFQFTIWQIMTWTATVAVIMSALHYLPDDLLHRLPFHDITSLLVAAVSMGSVAFMSIWLVFGKKWLALRILGALVAIGMGSWLLNWGNNMGWWYFGMLLSYEAAWTIISLLVVRWAGYRLTWHWRLRRFKMPSEAAG